MDALHQKAVRQVMAQATEVIVGLDDEKAIRKVLLQATDAIHRLLNTQPDRLKITETITDAVAKEGVTPSDIDAALKG